MKLDKIIFEATIPCSQYANIRPTIEMSDVTIEEAEKKGMELILPLFEKYSEKGGLIPRELVSITIPKLKSFNEEGVEIGFEPISHKYFYEGKPLIGVTDYIKKFYKPFDTDTISSVLESKWGVPQQVIRDLWEKGGEITQDLGNLIDKTLCYYEKFKNYGDIISSQKKEEDNYCLPKHPFLQKIVKEFYEIVKDGDSKIINQIMLSSIKDGICGTADRIKIIDLDKKICDIEDFKVNINAEEIDKSYKVLAPFEKLPANKLSKYQLQMSLYANLLTKSGWTVNKLRAYVFEEKWKVFEFDVLDVLSTISTKVD